MRYFLIPLLAALALPKAVFANEVDSFGMSDNEANKIFLGQVLSICYGVDKNHITMKQKIDMLGFAINLHEVAHKNKKSKEKDQITIVTKALQAFPDCFPEINKGE